MKEFIGEFKEFISRGNVLDMAVGVIIGGAFSKIVSSLVDNIFMPIIGMIIGGLDFSELSISFKGASINYGLFLQNVVDFLIVAICLFLVIKAMNKINDIKKKKEMKEQEKEEKVEPKSNEVILLEEIRDLLKKKN